jgi:siroheme synthase-like protein
VVVGGGKAAERAVAGMLDRDAELVVVSPRVAPGLASLAGRGKLQLLERAFEGADVKGALLVFAATEDAVIDRAVITAAREAGALVHVSGDPLASDFVTPALVERGGLSVAVSTGGRSPALAQHLRDGLAEQIGPEYAEFLQMLDELRGMMHDRFPRPGDRERAWQRVLSSPALELLRARRHRDARAALTEALAE